jgi:pyruvate-ferredoxin/flavodoxin oxidoreductase
MKEARFAMLARSKPADSARLLEQAQSDITARYQFYEQLANVDRTVVPVVAAEESKGGNGAGNAEQSKEVNS